MIYNNFSLLDCPAEYGGSIRFKIIIQKKYRYGFARNYHYRK
jgi:hypothetical protein